MKQTQRYLNITDEELRKAMTEVATPSSSGSTRHRADRPPRTTSEDHLHRIVKDDGADKPFREREILMRRQMPLTRLLKG